jgi:ankyrin repeat protein
MRRSIALERALRAGDLDAARAALAQPDDFPNPVDAGADPGVRTRIDDHTTPGDAADADGHPEIARMLRSAAGG